MIKSIEEAEIIEGTIVLIRTDWNVPVDETGKILDTSRIEATLPTINFALGKGAKVIIMSHLGDGADSLEDVTKVAGKFFPDTQVKFMRDPWNKSSTDGWKVLENLKNGEVAVIENLRFWMEKENDECFAEKLSEFGDIYVNEAFPCSHRVHTSIVLLPKLLPHYAGFHFLEEYKKLSGAFNPEHPFLLVLGGVKFDTKLPLVEKFLEIADYIFIGGALAVKAKEMIENSPTSLKLRGTSKIIFPVGDIAALDANTETLEILDEKIKEAKFVLWNGPLGDYEKGFAAGTFAVARMIKESGVKAIICGGDTENVIDEVISNEPNIFVSLAGGATLEFLATGTLPGIEALK